MSETTLRPTYAPKLSIGWIVRLYQADALGLRDIEAADKVGWRLYARCRDVLMVSASRVACPVCQTEFTVRWIAQPEDLVSTCPQCGWSITAGAYHASFRHQDLLGNNALPAFEQFVAHFPVARSYEARMLLIDRLVHAIHTTGGLAARNLLEGHPRHVLAALDALARPGERARSDVISDR
jgi:ribosomal protein L37AE/L43A